MENANAARTTIHYYNVVSVILLIVRLAGGAILWEKANVKGAVAALGREDRRCTRHILFFRANGAVWW